MQTKSDLNFTKQILPYLLLSYNQIEAIGLMSGKMGGILFFMLYAKKTGINAYNEYCDELFNDIYEQICTSTEIGLYNGLCGVGLGVEFLIQNNFVEGNTDDILEEIDKIIMERNPERMLDRSFNNGLGGILFYVITRLKSFDRGNGIQPFDPIYLDSLQQSINKPFATSDNVPQCLIAEFNEIMCKRICYDLPLPLPEFITACHDQNTEKLESYDIGFAGLTGIALKNILL